VVLNRKRNGIRLTKPNMTYPLDENECNIRNQEEANETFDEVTEEEKSLSDSGVVY
jgi:hypothetical protein